MRVLIYIDETILLLGRWQFGFLCFRTQKTRLFLTDKSFELFSILARDLSRLWKFSCMRQYTFTEIAISSTWESWGNKWMITNCLSLQFHSVGLAKVSSPWWKHIREVPRWYPTTVIMVTCLFIFPLRNRMRKKKKKIATKQKHINNRKLLVRNSLMFL